MYKKVKKEARKVKRKLGVVFGRKYVDTILKNEPIKKNLIVFESFFGRSISDNPLAIYNYIDKEKYECVFIVNKPSLYPDFKTVKRNSLTAYKYLKTAKLIINNSRMPKYWEKRDDQVYLQTWHGTPLKKLVFDLSTFEMPSASSLDEYTDMFSGDVKKWDYLLSTCSFATQCFRTAFRFEKEILEIGYPRNQKMYDYTNEDTIKIKENLGISLDKKVILYAPTYRDDQNEGVGNYYFNSELDFEKIQKEFPNHIILLRYHYIVSSSNDFENDNVLNVSDYSDISDLYLVSDILITDYSSVFFDYSILKKPFLFFTPDLDKYANDLRGFYLDINEDFPSKPAKTTDELIEQIKNIDRFNYSDFTFKYNPNENKNCMNKVIELIDDIVEAK